MFCWNTVTEWSSFIATLLRFCYLATKLPFWWSKNTRILAALDLFSLNSFHLQNLPLPTERRDPWMMAVLHAAAKHTASPPPVSQSSYGVSPAMRVRMCRRLNFFLFKMFPEMSRGVDLLLFLGAFLALPLEITGPEQWVWLSALLILTPA